MERASLTRAVGEALERGGLAAAAAGVRVTVAFPDPTRPLDPEATLGPLVEHLAGAAEVTVVVATGLHRGLTPEERAPLARVVRGARLLEHDARGPELVRVAEDAGGLGRALPAVFHRAVVQADLLVLAGLVEPHQYAGFSGGIKTVAIGCAGAETIGRLHGLELLRAPGTALGVLEGNPFHAALWRLGAYLPPAFALQLVPSDPPQVFAGPAREAFTAAAAAADRACFFEVEAPWAWLHLVVPAAKAQSFYQASRAATYVALARPPALASGGAILLEASCPEGLGQGAGELAFAEALGRGRGALLAELAGTSDRALGGGEQRAFVLAKALEGCRLALVGAPPLPELLAFGVSQHATVPEALAALGASGPGARLDNVFHRVPRLAAGPSEVPR